MKNSMNVLIISVILGILLIGSFIVFGKKTQEEALTLPIRVEEYSDFQCPACKNFFDTAEQIKELEDVEFIYKHFPLTKIHDRAYQAAVASEAAREQDKFKEFHDLLFANQDKLQDEDFFRYAEDLEMDVEKFKEDYNNNQELKNRVDADIKEGESIGINSTPTLIVNGERFTIVGKDTQQILDDINEMVEKARENEESTEEDINEEDSETTPTEEAESPSVTPEESTDENTPEN